MHNDYFGTKHGDLVVGVKWTQAKAFAALRLCIKYLHKAEKERI
jgi:hypothetical protein